MERNFQRSLSLVLKWEGGFVNHPKDPGGATNKGITLATYRRYVKRNGAVDDLKRITDEQVATVYRKQYWDAVKGDDLPFGVDYAVFDFAVNSGPARAKKVLQKALGVAQDGVIGPVTLSALAKVDHVELIETICGLRMSFLRGLPTWKTFGKGWTNRVNDVTFKAIEMVGSKPVSEKPTQTSDTPAQPKQSLLSLILSFLSKLFRRS